MLKHAVAEYALWCDRVAAQIPSFYAIQSWLFIETADVHSVCGHACGIKIAAYHLY
jgi:hypothetical protein